MTKYVFKLETEDAVSFVVASSIKRAIETWQRGHKTPVIAVRRLGPVTDAGSET